MLRSKCREIPRVALSILYRVETLSARPLSHEISPSRNSTCHRAGFLSPSTREERRVIGDRCWNDGWNDRNTEEEEDEKGKKRQSRSTMFVSGTMKSVCRTMGQRTIRVSILIDVHAHREPWPVRFFDAYSAGQKFLLPCVRECTRVISIYYGILS